MLDHVTLQNQKSIQNILKNMLLWIVFLLLLLSFLKNSFYRVGVALAAFLLISFFSRVKLL